MWIGFILYRFWVGNNSCWVSEYNILKIIIFIKIYCKDNLNLVEKIENNLFKIIIKERFLFFLFIIIKCLKF